MPGYGPRCFTRSRRDCFKFDCFQHFFSSIFVFRSRHGRPRLHGRFRAVKSLAWIASVDRCISFTKTTSVLLQLNKYSIVRHCFLDVKLQLHITSATDPAAFFFQNQWYQLVAEVCVGCSLVWCFCIRGSKLWFRNKKSDLGFAEILTKPMSKTWMIKKK